MRKSVLLLLFLLLTLTSCLHNRWYRHLEERHSEKENFALKVFNNPTEIDLLLKDSNFTSNIFHNYYDYHKIEIIKKLENAKLSCNGKCEINYSDMILPLNENIYLVSISNYYNIELSFYWRLINGKWDFSGINVDTVHLVKE
jgi:hypothetical protein